MKSVSLKVEYIETAKLKLHDQNPRTITGPQFKTLCESIQSNPDFFEVRPILCNKDFVVFAGNMRLRAALELGLTEVPVVVMDISKEKQAELLIRDNVQNGEWNIEALANSYSVEELGGFGIDVSSLLEPEPEVKKKGSTGCDRCDEIRTSIHGHEKRSGHKIMHGEASENEEI